MRPKGPLLGHTDSTLWFTAEPGGGGDSGSAIMTGDGLALGILDWGSGVVAPAPYTGPLPVVGNVFVSSHLAGVRLDVVLQGFRAMGYDLELVTGGPVNPVCLPDA